MLELSGKYWIIIKFIHRKQTYITVQSQHETINGRTFIFIQQSHLQRMQIND